MSSAPGYRELAKLAWPIVLARSAQSVIGFCDAAMVAPLGEDALAAATTGALNAMGMLALPMGTVYIVQSYAAQLAGAGDLAGARRYAWYGLLIAALSFVLAVLAIPLIDPVLGLTSHTAPVREAMSSYMAIRLLSVGVVVGTEAFGHWFAGLGDTTVAMRASLTAMVVNVVFNWILIYGNLGAPALGVDGAAWASAIASVAGFAVAGLAFHRARDRKTFAPAAHAEPGAPVLADSSEQTTHARALARMLRFGLPNGLNWFLEFSAFLIFLNWVVAELGTVATAAMMAVFAVNSVSFMPAFGLANAGAVLVGQAIGAGRPDDVPGLVWRTWTATAAWQGLVGVAYFAIPGPLMLIFSPDEARAADGVTAVGATLLAISAAWQLFDATVMTVSEALRAAGDTAWTLWARIILAWVVWLPGAWLAVFVLEGGAPAATWSMVLYFVTMTVAFVLRFRGGAWRHIDLTGRREGA